MHRNFAKANINSYIKKNQEYFCHTDMENFQLYAALQKNWC